MIELLVDDLKVEDGGASIEVGDEYQDIIEYDVPNLNWFECTMLPRGDMLAIIQQHKDLDGRSVNLFRNALERKRRSDLLDHYVRPPLYHPGSHYIYTTPDPSRFRYKNWRPEVTAIA